MSSAIFSLRTLVLTSFCLLTACKISTAERLFFTILAVLPVCCGCFVFSSRGNTGSSTAVTNACSLLIFEAA
jgi:hypothetical protein